VVMKKLHKGMPKKTDDAATGEAAGVVVAA
jgi:hypothetical protein